MDTVIACGYRRYHFTRTVNRFVGLKRPLSLRSPLLLGERNRNASYPVTTMMYKTIEQTIGNPARGYCGTIAFALPRFGVPNVGFARGVSSSCCLCRSCLSVATGKPPLRQEAHQQAVRRHLAHVATLPVFCQSQRWYLQKVS